MHILYHGIEIEAVRRPSPKQQRALMREAKRRGDNRNYDRLLREYYAHHGSPSDDLNDELVRECCEILVRYEDFIGRFASYSWRKISRR